MPTWKNNLSYGYTWLTLVRLNQTNVDFVSAQETKIEELVFYSKTISKDMLETEALNLANTMHTVFTVGMGARLEQGVDLEDAIPSMANILMDGDKTIEDLAVNNDEMYLFLNEQTIRP